MRKIQDNLKVIVDILIKFECVSKRNYENNSNVNYSFNSLTSKNKKKIEKFPHQFEMLKNLRYYDNKYTFIFKNRDENLNIAKKGVYLDYLNFYNNSNDEYLNTQIHFCFFYKNEFKDKHKISVTYEKKNSYLFTKMYDVDEFNLILNKCKGLLIKLTYQETKITYKDFVDIVFSKFEVDERLNFDKYINEDYLKPLMILNKDKALLDDVDNVYKNKLSAYKETTFFKADEKTKKNLTDELDTVLKLEESLHLQLKELAHKKDKINEEIDLINNSLWLNDELVSINNLKSSIGRREIELDYKIKETGISNIRYGIL